MTSIEWTMRVLNPTTGCDRVSPGCDHCYALTMAKRLKGMGQPKYQNDGDPKTSGPGFGLTTHAGVVTDPFKWRSPQRVFVNSMSDLLHADVPDDFIGDVFAVMCLTPQHTYQLLTKRHARLRSLLSDEAFQGYVAGVATRMASDYGPEDPARGNPTNLGRWPLPNVWVGVSAEDQHWADIRIPALLKTPAAVRWVSAEPLLGPLLLADEWIGADPYRRDEPSLSWLVAGGESGPGARPMHPNWARSLRDQCTTAGVPYFFKQHGAWAPRGRLRDGEPLPVDNARTLILNDSGLTRGRAAGSLSNGLCEFSDGSHCEVMEHVGKKAAGRELDGRTWDEYPQPVAEVTR